MRVKSRLFAFLMASAFGAAGAAAAEPEALRGEVVDLSCYLGRGASGSEHAACANRCIASSHTAGFRAEDGSVYLLLRAQGAPPPDEIVADLAGVPVEIEGSATERDGFRAFRITAARAIE